ncbi:DNA methyltransferase [Novosphingobium resinovorum]|uniref:DNA methyltransferase n=1 Tax=Novosphingobium resinovorum TaxID=158500 RepID=UPI003AF3A47B
MNAGHDGNWSERCPWCAPKPRRHQTSPLRQKLPGFCGSPANHPEHTDHPCQFPVELAERCVLALSNVGETVLDPFIGTGATAIAAVKHHRHAVGIDRHAPYLAIAEERIAQYAQGVLPLRPLGKPVRRPRSTERVAQVPLEWTQVEIDLVGAENGKK